METDHILPRVSAQLDYAQALAEVAKALTSNLEVRSVLDTVMRCVSQLLRPQHWSLMLVDQEKKELYFAIAVGDAAEAIRNLRLPIGEGIAGWVAQHGEAVVVPDVAKDARFTRRIDDVSKFKTSSILCVPLMCRNVVLGVIELVKDPTDVEPFTEEHLSFLAPFADFAAIAIDNASSFQKVKELSVIDEWTTLFNARYLNSCLETEVARAQRYSRPLSVVFFDLDHFKEVNDRFGHAVGSATLRKIGELLKSSIRDTDHPTRYGGDEFVLVMPETGKKGALVVAERIRRQIESADFSGGIAEFVRVTASFGVATVPENGDNPRVLLDRADQALYAAKAAGRNKVVDASSVAKDAPRRN